MARFELARRALADVLAIADYSADRWGRQKARAYLDALQACLAHLADAPSMGRRRGELAPGLSSFPFRRHVVFYLTTEFGITVVRILHERQDPVRHVE